MKLPTRRGEVVQSATAEGWTVYVPETESLHVLNATAKAIWDLCDGSTRASEMAYAISELTGMPIEGALTDVESTLERLESLGLVGL